MKGVLTETYIGDDLQPMREQDRAAGSSGRSYRISENGFGAEKGFSVYLGPINGGKVGRTLAGAPMSF